ncbi:MAG TPA: APC family permease [Kofleriaceae bacterium]|nr:APC family permease [Kofleriaceae bacterium]
MSSPDSLRREVGLGGATLLGLGSILGTGVFVSIGLAAGVAGPSVILAVVLAAIIATFNGLSSAQLAAAHPVSGGTYEYGHRFVNAPIGFAAGWMFLCAKSASAATAALGFSGYLLHALERGDQTTLTAIAVGVVVVLTLIVAGGIRRSNRTNAVIVSVTLVALIAFVVTGAPEASGELGTRLTPFFGEDGIEGLLHATALMFVAFTGYGRIATLGEEVRAPSVTIPRAIITTLAVSAAIYVAVAVVAVGAAGTTGLGEVTRQSAAPLELIARGLGHDTIGTVIAIGAITAMAGVLLNLILGLSRVLLAMGRRGDMPVAVATVHEGNPRRAVLVMGLVIAGLALIGDVKTTWSFSAFTVLVYYALTNLAALRLPAELRRYPRWVPGLGLVSCLFVAFWVEPRVWLAGLGVLAAGFVWRAVWRALTAPRSQSR